MVQNNSNYDDQLIQLLNEYLDGQLSPEQAEAIEKRLIEDPHARQLFLELKQVAKMVHELPRITAPEDLTEQIQMQLEREVLLGVDQQHTESAGRFQLQLRRWLSLAAMLMLTGAVVFIIYSVMIGNPWFQPIDEPTRPDDTMVQGDPTTSPIPIEADTDEIAPPKPQLTLVHLQIRSDNHPSSQETMKSLLAELGIQSEQRASAETQQAEFAFQCRSDQLKSIFQTFQDDPNQHVDLILVDEQTSEKITISDIGVTPMLTLALQSDYQKRNGIAQAIIDRTFTEDSDPQDLPEWLIEAVRQAQPPIGVVQLGRFEQDRLIVARDPNAVEKPEAVIEPNNVKEQPGEMIAEPAPKMIDVLFTIPLERVETRPPSEIK